MKKMTIGAVVLGCAGVLGAAAVSANGQSCNMPGMAASSGQDKQFVTMAAQSDFTEITFSTAAVQKASDPKVKAYAQRMITDHNQLEAEMKPVADKLGVTPPTALDAEHQQLFDQMNQLSGAAFDKQYMSAMDTDHHKALDAFKAEAASTQDKQLKPIVKKGEKVVAMHTQMADKMSGKMGGSASGM